MKKPLKIAAILGVAACLSLTAVGCAGGCNQKTRNLASLKSNWYADVTFKGIQPTMDVAEELVYDIVQEEGANRNYSVKYEGGTYETTFKAVTFDYENLAGEFSDEYKEGAKKGVSAYYYKTYRHFDTVTFTCKGESRTFEGDEVLTECYFLSAKDYLRPLYSKQVIKSTTPTNMQVASVDDAYTVVDREHTSYYSLSGDTVVTEIIDNTSSGDEKYSTTRTSGLNSNDYSVFDVSSLEIAVRAMSHLNSGLSQTVSLYTPGRGGSGVGTYQLTGSAAATYDDGDKSAAYIAETQSLLEANGLFKPVTKTGEDGTQTTSSLSTVAVSVTYSGGTLTGVSPTLWYAKIENQHNNTARATMVKKTEPLTYGLGNLHYELKEIKSTLWNN